MWKNRDQKLLSRSRVKFIWLIPFFTVSTFQLLVFLLTLRWKLCFLFYGENRSNRREFSQDAMTVTIKLPIFLQIILSLLESLLKSCQGSYIKPMLLLLHWIPSLPSLKDNYSVIVHSVSWIISSSLFILIYPSHHKQMCWPAQGIQEGRKDWRKGGREEGKKKKKERIKKKSSRFHMCYHAFLFSV